LVGSSVALGVLEVEPLVALPDGEVLVEPLAEDGELGVVVPDAEPDAEPGVVVPDAEPDAEPDGELGVVAEPEDEVAPELGVARRSPVLSPQAVSRPAPSAMEIATAKAESLI
jgi:hypothetical protein